jgi:hypothetical protein
MLQQKVVVERVRSLTIHHNASLAAMPGFDRPAPSTATRLGPSFPWQEENALQRHWTLAARGKKAPARDEGPDAPLDLDAWIRRVRGDDDGDDGRAGSASAPRGAEEEEEDEEEARVEPAARGGDEEDGDVRGANDEVVAASGGAARDWNNPAQPSLEDVLASGAMKRDATVAQSLAGGYRRFYCEDAY